MKKYQNFLSESFPFLVVKSSIYLNRHVFVMGRILDSQECKDSVQTARMRTHIQVFVGHMSECTFSCWG